MADNTVRNQLYNQLVSNDFDVQVLDSMGKPIDDVNKADLFSFEYKTENKNYGTVVVLVDSEDNMEVYFGDNLGKTMDDDDKTSWYDFLYMLRMLAKRNMLTFTLNNLNKLKYNMKTMAAMTEGMLLEGYYGTTKTSYSNQPMETKLIIKHSRPLGEDDARFRNIKTLFVQTQEGERFKLPFTNLTGGKAMARHVAEGGNPYDAFGQHIVEMMAEMATLQKFIRATRNKTFGGEAESLAESALQHYQNLKRKAKRMISRRGYHAELESYDPITISDVEETVDAVREIFVQQSLDNRIEEALPFLARLAAGSAIKSAFSNDVEETNMKEVDAFESWADTITEQPVTPGQMADFEELMSAPIELGPDATNAIEQLYGVVDNEELYQELIDLSAKDPNADARPIIKKYVDQQVKESKDHTCSCCGNDIDDEGKCGCGPECEHCGGHHDIEEVIDIDTGEQTLKANRDPMLEELERLLQLSR